MQRIRCSASHKNHEFQFHQMVKVLLLIAAFGIAGIQSLSKTDITTILSNAEDYCGYWSQNDPKFCVSACTLRQLAFFDDDGIYQPNNVAQLKPDGSSMDVATVINANCIEKNKFSRDTCDWSKFTYSCVKRYIP